MVPIGLVDDGGNVLSSCLASHQTKVGLRHQTICRPTPEYDTGCCALLGRRGLPRNDLEETLRDRFAEIRTGKPGGRGGGVLICCLLQSFDH